MQIEALIVLMIAENIISNRPETFTLCFKDNKGDVHPISDINCRKNADFLASSINKTDYIIKVKELSDKREINVYQRKDKIKKVLIKTFCNLKDALNFINIRVDFEVEPPEVVVDISNHTYY